MSVLPSPSAPFGFLEPIHRYLVDNAQPINSTTANVLNYSTALLCLQALLLQFPDTRPARAAIGVVALAVSVATWSTVRFVEPWFDALNNGLGVGFLHNTFKSIVFAFVKDPVTVPYKATGLWRIVAAIDIAFNSRWIGLRTLQYDGLAPRVPPRVPHVPRTRTRSLARHAGYALMYWIIFSTVVETIRALGWDTIGRKNPPPHALDRFLDTAYTLLPGTYAIAAPRWFMSTLIKLLTGTAVWLSLAAGYHTFALVFIGSGMHAPTSWDRDTFNKPLNSTSLFDFWRRWHQLFTQHFSLVSTCILTSLGLPARSWLAVPIVFFLSGSMHALGQLSMEIPPDPLKVANFFWLSGLGVCLEMAFKKVTGRRVGGVPGRIWFWLYMYNTCTGAVAAEYQSGLGGSKVCPPPIEAVGKAVVGVIRRYIVDRADGTFP